MRLTMLHRTVLLVMVGMTVVTALWWKCRSDPAINFLPADNQAEWIIFPTPVDAGAHKIAMLDTTFQREFEIATPPKLAELQIRAARRVELRVNDKPVDIPPSGNWKKPSTINVTPFLQTGSNRIQARVFNDDGPPALWLRLSADSLQLRTDGNWQATFAASAWRPAISVDQQRHPLAGNLLAGGETIFGVLSRIWPCWVGFAIAAVVAVLFGNRILSRATKSHRGQAAILLAVGALAWLALGWNNTRLLPFHCGYDSTYHVAYIKYLQERQSLPLPTEGFESFQPPLYYALSAAVLSAARLTVADPGSIAVLRLLTICFGIGHFLLVFLCLRLLFPGRPRAQLVGSLIAACLPMQLYLSNYVTNETLAAGLISLSIYLALRILSTEHPTLWQFCGLGLCVGAAMLTKATALLLIPPLFGALILKMVRNKVGLRFAGRSVVMTLAGIVLVCGWYYTWIWKHFGTPIVGNWERRFGFTWWQEPGFHTAVHYFRFGRALIDPLFSGYNSFLDGIFSTLWGDALGGGLSDTLSRTPWNYGLMVGGYWLALIPTLLIIVGFVVAIYRFVRLASAESFLLIGFSAAVAVGVVFMTLRVPSYAQVKAFYGLSTLVPLCTFAAIGWEKLQSLSSLRLTAGAFLIAWALNSFFTFWIQDSAKLHVYAGRKFFTDHRMDAAVKEATQAAAKGGLDATPECFCAAVLDESGQSSEASVHLQRGMTIDPANGFCHLQTAIVLAKQNDLERATSIANAIIDSEPENARAYNLLFTCAQQARQTDKALTIGSNALAISPFDADLHYRFGLAAAGTGDFRTAVPHFAYALLLQPARSEFTDKLRLALAFAAQGANGRDNLEAIAAAAPESPLLFDQLAWIFATAPDSAVRNGAKAVLLSERACRLTEVSSARLILTLAASYAEAGRFSDATSAADQAIILAKSAGDTSTVELGEKLLSAFQSQQPYREQPRS